MVKNSTLGRVPAVEIKGGGYVSDDDDRKLVSVCRAEIALGSELSRGATRRKATAEPMKGVRLRVGTDMACILWKIAAPLPTGAGLSWLGRW
jgi:hypothetical protein